MVPVLHSIVPCHSELGARSLQRHLLTCQKVCHFYDPTERVEGNGNAADRDAALVVQVEAPAPEKQKDNKRCVTKPNVHNIAVLHGQTINQILHTSASAGEIENKKIAQKYNNNEQTRVENPSAFPKPLPK